MAAVRAARIYLRFDPLLRFRSLTRRVGECWIWKGCVDRKGRPLFFPPHPEVGGRYRKALARNFAYRQFVAPDAGRVLLANVVCGNALCVNPTHWRPKSEVPRRRVSRGVVQT